MNIAEKNIYLIGPRACGKTSLGRILAAKLDREFVDLDERFVKDCGQSIAQVVESQGWDKFRELETEVLARTAQEQGLVVATGGGVVLGARNRELLGQGVVVYLQADPEVLLERLTSELLAAQRPSLTGLELSQEIKAVLAEREPLYLASSQIILPPGELQDLADKLAQSLETL